MKLDTFLSVVSIITLSTLAIAHPSTAQIIPDTTLAPNQSVVTPNGSISEIYGGVTVGKNLFHSFEQFSLPTGSTAYFQNVLGIENIISRVTGSSASYIDGLIKANGSASLFLINPHGIIFGINAQLDIGGSFLATTANSFKFADGSEFSATNLEAPPLLTISAPVGVQFGTNQPGNIVNAAHLAVQLGQNLTLSGGSVTSTGKLQAPGGEIQLQAVLGDVEVRQLTAKTATLSASRNLNLVESQLQTTGDLLLLAQDTVRVRDSLGNPFLAIAGGNLYIQGDRHIDILALNHPQTPFQSGGNLTLVSDGNISGDAHFTSGGKFAILNLAGQAGNFVSLHDPIISSVGDVTFGNYTGTSLKIESTGSITGGDININAPDITLVGTDPDIPILTGGRAVILRAGLTSLANPANTPQLVGGATFNSPGGASSGTINVGNLSGGGVQLTTILSATGNIQTQNITSNGGNIDILSSNGAINTTGFTLDSSNSLFNGGRITLTGTAINTGSLNSASSYNFVANTGNGGAINLTATNGNINTGFVDSSSYATQGSSGVGGAVTIKANNGNIITNGIQSSSYGGFGPTDDGGAIALTATNGYIQTGDLISYSKSNFYSGLFIPPLPIGNGGAIALNATNGIKTATIQSYALSSSVLDPVGSGGAITLNTTNGDIITDQIASTSFAPVVNNGTVGNGGDVAINTNNGNVSIGKIVSGSAKGDGGNINVSATNGNINAGALLSYSGAKSPNLGNGGNINLLAVNGNIVTNSMISSGNLESGNITVTTNQKFSSDNTIISTTNSGTGKSGDIQITAGTVSLTNGTQVSTSTSSQGAGGNLTIIASDLVQLSGSSPTLATGITANQNGLFAEPGNPFNIPAGEQLGGYIPPVDFALQFGSVQFPTGLYTQTTGAGNAGNLRVETGQLIIQDRGAIAATTFSSGNAGNISVKAHNIALTNGSILSGVGSGAIGNSGNINIQTNGLTLTSGGLVQTLTLGQGKAGNIQVNASQSVNLSGVSPTQGFASGLLSGTEGTNSGQGGNISVNTKTLQVQNHAILSATTSNNSPGGNIAINATNSVELSQGGSLLAQSSGSGTAGNLQIATEQLILQDSSSATVSSSGTGNSGNIEVTAGSIFLNNQAQLIAETASGEGGNINLQVRDNIIIRNNSLISAEALGNGNGGNITINAGGLILAFISENSDIVANAYQGRGGNISATAYSIFGFRQFQNRRTPESDFTASSALGINGTVKLNLVNSPNLDNLPTDLVDIDRLVGQDCQVTGKIPKSSFIVTGLGGLPPSPNETLNEDNLAVNWVMPSAEKLVNQAGEMVNPPHSPTQLVEAQGWVMNEHQQIVLTAQVPKVKPQSSWQKPVACVGRGSPIDSK
jgi:filamentous hemagglutinin family protein